MEKFLEKVLDFIYPIKCTLCNETVIKRGNYICNSCESKLETDVIVRYLNDEFENEKVKCLSVFKYAKEIKSSIWRFKFRGYKHYSEFFAKMIANEVLDKFRNMKFDHICFVPLRKERKKNRGYNQAECLACDVSKFINVPCKDILMKVKSNHVQHELDLADRRENVKGVYDVRINSDVKGKTILVCDDIVTTGSTLSECVKVLFENGAKEVHCCTIAHIPKPSFSNRHQ